MESCDARHVGAWIRAYRKPDKCIYHAHARGRECEASRGHNRSRHSSKLRLRADGRSTLRREKPNSQWSSNRWEASPAALHLSFHGCTSGVCGNLSLEWSLAIRPISFRRRGRRLEQTLIERSLLCHA